jgi:hypothetical protein
MQKLNAQQPTVRLIHHINVFLMDNYTACRQYGNKKASKSPGTPSAFSAIHVFSLILLSSLPLLSVKLSSNSGAIPPEITQWCVKSRKVRKKQKPRLKACETP